MGKDANDLLTTISDDARELLGSAHIEIPKTNGDYKAYVHNRIRSDVTKITGLISKCAEALQDYEELATGQANELHRLIGAIQTRLSKQMALFEECTVRSSRWSLQAQKLNRWYDEDNLWLKLMYQSYNGLFVGARLVEKHKVQRTEHLYRDTAVTADLAPKPSEPFSTVDPASDWRRSEISIRSRAGEHLAYDTLDTDETLDNRAAALHLNSNLLRHEQHCRQRLNDRCEWILETPEYVKWRAFAAPSPVLWCHGAAGIGKSTLASFLIEELQQSLDVVAFFYFEPRTTQRPLDVFESLVYQLQTQLAQKQRHVNYTPSGGGEEILRNTLKGLLRKHQDSYRPTTIILDGLDEDMNNLMRMDILLVDLIRSGSRIFVTSRTRPPYHLKKLLHESRRYPPIELRYWRSYDLATFAETIFHDRSTAPAYAILKKHDNLLRETINAAIAGAEGSYALTHMNMETLMQQTNLAALEKCLKRTREGEHDWKALIAISNGGRSEVVQQLLETSLVWLAQADQPLYIYGLQEALAFADINRAGGNYLPTPDQMPNIEVLQSFSQEFVVIDANKDTLALRDDKLRKHLRKRMTLTSTPIISLAEISIAYLCAEDFTVMDIEHHRNIDNMCTKHCFLKYAASTWQTHIRRCELTPTSRPDYSKLLDDERRLQTCLAVKNWCQREYWEWDEASWSQQLKAISAAGILARTAVECADPAYLEKHLTSNTAAMQPKDLSSLLQYAFKVWDADKKGFKMGNDVNRETFEEQAKCVDIIYGYFLDSTSANASRTASEARDPHDFFGAEKEAFLAFFDSRHGLENCGTEQERLCIAISSGNDLAFRSALCRTNFLDRLGAFGLTPLHTAVAHRKSMMVTQLLKRGASAEQLSRSNYNAMEFTPLHEATRLGDLDTMKELLSYEADINLRDESGRTVLFSALERIREQGWSKSTLNLIKFIIREQIDIDAKREDGVTALQDAATHLMVDTVMLLLRYGADSVFAVDTMPKTDSSDPEEERQRLKIIEILDNASSVARRLRRRRTDTSSTQASTSSGATSSTETPFSM